MEDNDKTPCYIARCKCGCGALVFASVNLPKRAKENAKECAKMIRAGYTIESMPVDGVRAAHWR